MKHLRNSENQFGFSVINTMKTKFLQQLGILVVFCFLLCSSRAENGKAEFTEPLKNISTTSGTNVEFSCVVRNLENHRVMWLQREGERDILVAINSLKVSKNPRMTVSVMQSSGDVTRSTLYIYNVDKSDSGAYVCSVGVDPIIDQVGTLDVTASTDINTNEATVSSSNAEKTTTEEPIIRICDKDITHDCTIDANQNDENENLLCIDLGQLWEKARLKVDKMLSSMYTFFVKITE